MRVHKVIEWHVEEELPVKNSDKSKAILSSALPVRLPRHGNLVFLP